MQRKACILLTLFVLLRFPQIVSAAPLADLKDNQAVLQFPDTVTFKAHIESPVEIESVVLEYGTQQQTCGTIIAKAFPQFSASKSVDVSWTWEMKQSGSLPPGATIWWRWRYIDQDGKETVSDTSTVTWLDHIHTWQTITRGAIRLHWYRGDTSFSQDLLGAAADGLTRVERDAGLKADQPIDLYIYASVDDLKDAILYEPSWVGGMAFAEHNVVIIGISAQDLEWGRGAEVHELTHVLVGHLTFSCLGDVPTWLNEGLAVYSEGDLDSASQAQLDGAIQADTLSSVRSLSGAFSEVSDKASLSYSESYSIVKFLIEKYGRENMTALLLALRDGNTVDGALTQVYGFDVDGLEDAWRAGIGAKARTLVSSPTAVATATYVPTIVPVSGVLPAISPTPMVFPATSTPVSEAPAMQSEQVLAGVVVLFCTCLIGILLIAIVVIAFMRLRRPHS